MPSYFSLALTFICATLLASHHVVADATADQEACIDHSLRTFDRATDEDECTASDGDVVCKERSRAATQYLVHSLNECGLSETYKFCGARPGDSFSGRCTSLPDYGFDFLSDIPCEVEASKDYAFSGADGSAAGFSKAQDSKCIKCIYLC